MNELNATPSHQPSKSMNQTNTNRPLTPPAGPPTKPATPTPSQFSTSPPKAGLQTQSPEPKPAPKPEPKPAAKPEPKAEPKAQVQSKPALATVRFEVEAPRATSVSVAGTFNDWKPGATPLTGVGGGKWAKEISLAPGRYEYRFVVDGQWTDDAKAKTYAPNPHGGRNAVIEVQPRS